MLKKSLNTGTEEPRKALQLPRQSVYPKKIYFRNEVYFIKFAKMKDYGDTDPDKKVIRLKKGMSPRETMSTLVHELLHVMEFEDPQLGKYLKHEAVYLLEKAVVEMLLDNFL